LFYRNHQRIKKKYFSKSDFFLHVKSLVTKTIARFVSGLHNKYWLLTQTNEYKLIMGDVNSEDGTGVGFRDNNPAPLKIYCSETQGRLRLN
jgi:hypothetical protein